MAVYNKQALPELQPSPEEIYWVAGFLEGEGTFSAMSGTDHRARVSAGQKTWEPLDRLLLLLGGRIYEQKGREYHMWILRGVRAYELMKLLYPMMSTRRKQQIDLALCSTYSVEHDSPERFEQRSKICGFLGKHHTQESKLKITGRPCADRRVAP